jgi:DNA-binding winged helix-turn-helix (wHTH) protein
MSPRPGHFYEFGDFRLDMKEHRLLRNGQLIPVYPKSLEALLVLVQHPGELMEREALMKCVWGDKLLDDANITVAISQ